MNKRERNMLLITLIIVVPVLAWALFAPEEDATEGEAASSGSVSSVRKEFERKYDLLRKREAIEQGYREISFDTPEVSAGRSVGETFENDIAALLKSTFKIPNPRVGRATPVAIPEDDDYCLVQLDVNVDGSLSACIGLLKDLDSQGLLIKNYQLSQQSGWRSQDGTVNLTVTIARLVEPDVETRSYLEGSRN